jgi:DNA-3-methyladenine glycosylase I
MSDFLRKHEDGLSRCKWAGVDELYVQYHDEEWGVPITGDQEMFERITLEGFQAGLSWITILKRREHFRKAFHNFNVKKVAKLTDSDVEALMLNEGIIRNRAKILSTIRNAQVVLDLQKQGESISDIVWSFREKDAVKQEGKRILAKHVNPSKAVTTKPKKSQQTSLF